MYMQKLLQEDLIRTSPVRPRTIRDRARIAQILREQREARAAG